MGRWLFISAITVTVTVGLRRPTYLLYIFIQITQLLSLELSSFFLFLNQILVGLWKIDTSCQILLKIDLIGSYFLLPGCIFSKKLWPQKTSADWPHMSEWKGLRWECGRTEVSEQCAQYVCDCVCCLWRLFVCLVDFPSHSNTMDRITVITDSWVCLCFQLRLTFIPHAAKKVCF